MFTEQSQNPSSNAYIYLIFSSDKELYISDRSLPNSLPNSLTPADICSHTAETLSAKTRAYPLSKIDETDCYTFISISDRRDTAETVSLSLARSLSPKTMRSICTITTQQRQG